MKTLIMIPALLIGTFTAFAADMSNGADNFYKSDKVTAQKVTFSNQYKMKVAGIYSFPRTLHQKREVARDHRRAPDGRSEGAERELVCSENR